MVVGIYLVLHLFSYGSQLSNKSHNFFNSVELVSYEVSFTESHELTSMHSFPFDKHLYSYKEIPNFSHVIKS